MFGTLALVTNFKRLNRTNKIDTMGSLAKTKPKISSIHTIVGIAFSFLILTLPFAVIGNFFY